MQKNLSINNIDENDDEYDILVGDNKSKEDDNDLQSFKNQIKDIVDDKSLEKKNLMKEQYVLKLKGELNRLDEQYAEKIENNKEYKDAKMAYRKAAVAIAGASVLIVHAPFLAPFLVTAIGALLVLAARKYAKTKEILKNIKNEFDDKKRLAKVQGRLNELNDPEIQRLDREIREKYEPKRINEKIKKLKEEKRKITKKASIFNEKANEIATKNNLQQKKQEYRDKALKAAIKEENNEKRQEDKNNKKENNKNVEIINNNINNNEIINQDNNDIKINDINADKLSKSKQQNNSTNKNDNMIKNAMKNVSSIVDDKNNSKLKITNVSKESEIKNVNINTINSKSKQTYNALGS